MKVIVDCLAVGVLEIDDHWRVHYANRAAQRALDAQDALSIAGGRLQFLRERERRLAGRLIAPGGAWATEPATLVVPRNSGRVPYVMQRVTAPRAVAPALPDRHWLLLIDPSQHGTVSAPLLHELFQLTPTQARCAQALMQGRSLSEFARQHRITIGTACRHLEGVFAKTGARRQAELVQLMLALAPPVQPPCDAECGTAGRLWQTTESAD